MLRQVLPEALRLDLLDASLYLELSRDPHRLEAIIGHRPRGAWIVLDEIQKAPGLLDEVHRLMESRRWRFALCGSSARKLRRGGANLLAGRAVTVNLEGFSASELGNKFDLSTSLDWGMLPFVQEDQEQAAEILSAYLNTYLKEEIREEGLVRGYRPLSGFCPWRDNSMDRWSTFRTSPGRQAYPEGPVDTYFSILMDTLLGHFLPAWRPGLKVREAAHPKFYWFDPGVARAAAGWLRDPADRVWLGAALETLVYHELRVYNEVSRKLRPLFFYRTPAGVEVDFIIETARRQWDSPPHLVAVEVKRAERWGRVWEKHLRSLIENPGLIIDRLIGVYCGSRIYEFDNLTVFPLEDFVTALFAGEIF